MILYLILTRTSSKSKEETFVGILFQEIFHPLAHPLIPLVDKLLTEIIVNLLSSDAFMRWKSGIDEVWNLGKK